MVSSYVWRSFCLTYTLDQELASWGLSNGATSPISIALDRTDKLNITGIWDVVLEARLRHDVTAANNVSLGYSPTNRLTTSYFAPWGQNTYTPAFAGAGSTMPSATARPTSTPTRRAW